MGFVSGESFSECGTGVFLKLGVLEVTVKKKTSHQSVKIVMQGSALTPE